MSGHVYTAGAMPRTYTHTRPPRAASALGVAALCVGGLALTWVVAALVPATHLKDAVALYDFTRLSRPRVDMLANGLLHLLDPLLYTVWALALVGVALMRGRPRVALAVVAVTGLAPLTAEILKPLLAHPHAQVGFTYINEASWPSGHATAAVALALSAVLVSPVWLGPAVMAFGALFAMAIGCSLLILAWHMPSDVFGGYLVASLWMALAVAGLRGADRHWPSARSRRGSGGSRVGVGVMRARVPE
jgi:membrane-associated phospholipid phosphatase